MVYQCTLQVRSVKSRFLRTYNSSTYRYEKAILYPRKQSNCSKLCTRQGQMPGKQSMSQNFCICSRNLPGKYHFTIFANDFDIITVNVFDTIFDFLSLTAKQLTESD